MLKGFVKSGIDSVTDELEAGNVSAQEAQELNDYIDSINKDFFRSMIECELTSAGTESELDIAAVSAGSLDELEPESETPRYS